MDLLWKQREKKTPIRENLKRKTFEKIPHSKPKKSKYTGRVGIAVEQKKILADIDIEKHLMKENVFSKVSEQIEPTHIDHSDSDCDTESPIIDIKTSYSERFGNSNIPESFITYTSIIDKLGVKLTQTVLKNGCRSLSYLDYYRLRNSITVHNWSQLKINVVISGLVGFTMK